MICRHLNHLKWLAVIKQMHYSGVPERVRRHRNGKVHAVVVHTPLRRLQPVAHGFAGGQSALHLTDVARIGERHQTHRILGRTPPPAAYLFRQDLHKFPGL